MEEHKNMKRKVLILKKSKSSNTLKLSGKPKSSNRLKLSGKSKSSNTLKLSGKPKSSNRLKLSGKSKSSNTLKLSGKPKSSNKLKLSGKSKSSNTLKLSGKSKKTNQAKIAKQEKLVKKVKQPKAKKQKNNPPPPVEEPISNKADRVEKHFVEKYPVWADCLPLSLGIADEIRSNYQKDYSIKSINLFMSRHVSKPKYLQNIICMEERRNLKGEVTHPITEKQKAHAKRKLERIKQELHSNSEC